MRKLRITFILIVTFTLLLSLSGCYTDYGLTTQDYDIVATFFNKGTDFKQFQTYTLIDSVVRVRDDGNSTSNPDTRYDQQILNKIAQNLDNYGYTPIPPDQVDSTNLPDVFILVSTVSSTNYAYSPGYWWGYWGWYPGWGYYPGYGPGWGGYYPGGVTYTYTTGSLLINMLEADNIDVANKTAVINWAATINGLLDDTKANTTTRINQAIDKSFKQSTYLKIN